MSKALVYLVLLLPLSCLAQLEPSNFPGLQLWLRSDTGVVVNASNKVSDWFDISGNGNHAFQTVTNFKPNLMSNVLMGYPSIWFDGTNDWLDFPELTDVRTVFWVVVEHGDATIQGRCLLGHNTQFDFFRGPLHNMWHSTFTSTSVLNGSTRVNFQDVNGTATTVPNEFSILSLVTTGNTKASRFSLDRELYSNVWDGELVELIIYNSPLTPEEVLQVENYLADRYTTPFFADDDVLIDYGFCDTTICAAPGFANYLWSSGEQTQCIDVNASGQYAIQAEDAFHRLRFDTVVVEFPGTLNFENAILCLGESETLATNLPPEDYTFIWQDESTTSEFIVEEAGSYYVLVNDTLQCSTVSNTAIFQVDSLEIIASISSSETICAGDYISLFNAPFALVDVLWSDESSDLALQVFLSDDYSVTAIDENGCIFSGEIAIEVAGEAPVPNFSMTTSCVNEVVTFLDMSTSNAAIDLWEWTINGESGGELSSIDFQFVQPGFHDVQLTVGTIEGCTASIDSTVVIYPVPTIIFGNSTPCSGYDISLYDLSIVNGGSITGWSWDVNGQLSDNPDIVINGATEDLEISLSVVSDAGCVGALYETLEVLPSPEVDFDYSGVCYGGLTLFQADVGTGAGDIIDYDWTFGDNTISGLANPTHFFTQAGSYDVILTAGAENGCYASNSAQVDIFALPELSFGPSQACVGQSALFTNTSVTNGGDWDSVLWVVSGVGQLSVFEPLVQFDQLGTMGVSLYMSTTNGCVNSTSQSISVIDVPEAFFTMSTVFGPPPLEVSYSANSTAGNTFSWNFGDGSTATGNFANHTFLESGVFVTTLSTTNPQGCTGSVAQQVFVLEPQPDILVDDVICLETDNGIRIAAVIQNLSGFQINDLQLSWRLGNDASVTELWTGQLMDGQAFQFEFESLANPSESNFNFICVEALELTTGFNDIHPENNEKCKVLDEITNAELLPVYPNPAQDILHLNFLMPENERVKITIYDGQGKLVFDGLELLLEKGYSNPFIDISAFRTGVYHLQANGSKSQLRASFVVLEP
jgi:PKD repeat protein